MQSDQIAASVESVIKQLLHLISGKIGTYPDGQHRIQLSADAVPVAIKTRPIPYAICEMVANAVHLLDQQGIWEPADKGDWADPLVTPAKSDGTVHTTTDLSLFNKYVIPTCFDVLTLAEIFQMVHGARFFSTLDLMKSYHPIPLAPEIVP